MEDRYDISVDIGEGKDWWCVHGLTTHDKVYELNKQMCDLGKTILTKKKNDMEEKKTKTMTKAEAFEYLKNRKVNTNGRYEEVLKKLFECGIEWNGGGRNIVDYGNYLIIDNDGHLFHCGCDMDERYWRTHLNEEISIDDILSIEIVDENRSEDEVAEIVELGKKIQSLLPKLSGHRHIVITEDDIILREEGMCLFHSDPF